MRNNSQTPLFVLFALVAFAALIFSFPFVSDQVLGFPFERYAGGGSRSQFYFILWIGAHIIGMFIYYLIFSWAFRQSAAFTSSQVVRRSLLLAGAVVCCGFLLYGLWAHYAAGASNARMLQRIVLSGLVLAIGGAALDAIRNGPMPSEDFTEYRNH